MEAPAERLVNRHKVSVQRVAYIYLISSELEVGKQYIIDSHFLCYLFHRIPTVQKEAIQPIESEPTTIPLRPYSCNPTYLPC